MLCKVHSNKTRRNSGLNLLSTSDKELVIIIGECHNIRSSWAWYCSWGTTDCFFLLQIPNYNTGVEIKWLVSKWGCANDPYSSSELSWVARDAAQHDEVEGFLRAPLAATLWLSGGKPVVVQNTIPVIILSSKRNQIFIIWWECQCFHFHFM